MPTEQPTATTVLKETESPSTIVWDIFTQFNGTSVDDHVVAWQRLNRADKWMHWRQAAVCASLARASGRRTDRTGGETDIQEFCRRTVISAQHFSRMAKTYTVFSEPLATGDHRLFDDDTLSFKHYLVAANYSALPEVAIIEAQQMKWTANDLARAIKLRKGQALVDYDGSTIGPEEDDDQPDVGWKDRTSERAAPRGLRPVRLVFTVLEYKVFAAHMRTLASLLGTTGITATILATVKRASEEWGRTASRCCPGCGEDLPPCGQAHEQGGASREAPDMARESPTASSEDSPEC
jgi:hypothetical protein